MKEEHIVLISEPGSNFDGHVVPKSCAAMEIVSAISTFLGVKSFSSVCSIGCDGTNTNTGTRGGVIVLWGQQINRPLQWLVCQLHANELPLRHLICSLDGVTSGPRCFSGPIGMSLSDCGKDPVQSFESICVDDFPIVLKTVLSTDQSYLYDMCLAVISGVCSESLSKRNPGKMAHSRWLTTANRILRKYVTTNSPSENLKILTNFIVKVYAVSWFNIKRNPSCVNGAKHLHNIIVNSRYLSEEIKQIVDPVLQRNGYFGHSENLLLAMMFDADPTIRKLALCRIKKARLSTATNFRKFAVPTLNLDAERYYNLINWQNTIVSDPPILRHLSIDELEMIANYPNCELRDVIKALPCHSQAVERHIQIVSQVSTTVCGADRRDGVIRNKIVSRKTMSKFNTKKDYAALKK